MRTGLPSWITSTEDSSGVIPTGSAITKELVKKISTENKPIPSRVFIIKLPFIKNKSVLAPCAASLRQSLAN
jgi:hypothetical protein